MQLEFKIENQSITRTDKNFVVEKSQNYLYAKFDFKTDDWEKAITKYAIFSNESYKDENSVMVEIKEDFTCLVPAQILLNSCCFKINVVGLNESGDYILTTNLSNVSLMSTGSTMGINPNEPQPSVITDILEKVSKSFSNFNFTYNPDNGYLVLQLIDNNKVISEQVVDLPTEQIIKNVSYNETTKKLTIEWANGQVSNIDFSTIIQDFYTKKEIDSKLKTKQDKLTFDTTPTASSNNPVTSGGVYEKISEEAKMREDAVALLRLYALIQSDDFNNKISKLGAKLEIDNNILKLVSSDNAVLSQVTLPVQTIEILEEGDE